MRSPTSVRRVANGFVMIVAITATGASAQDLGPLRDQLRNDLRDIQFAQSLLGLVLLSDELELSGARYSFDDESDTDLTVYALPFHTIVAPWGVDRPRVHIEGTLGYGEARQSAADLFSGQLPGLETAIRTKWRTYGGLFGVDQYVQLGGSLLFRTGERMPYGKGFALSGAVMLGEDFHGWTIGFRMLF